ncbi:MULTISPECIES: hypothetical protein [unclassified Ruegeria]|uniref:hypothetical protein n=1 Tax=unclassified Ruegeria TaxID=2625375 RepID=UPI001AE42E35|nr:MULTISPECIES: hypothetical protein [unclassified Ruegeria]
MSEECIPSDERLFHNLHPTDYDNGRVNSSAFNPSENHEYKLSVDRSSIHDAERSFSIFTSRGNKSVGVCGVMCADFSGEEIICFPDEVDDNPAHALADYSPHGVSQRKKKAKRLAKKAGSYGLDFQP